MNSNKRYTIVFIILILLTFILIGLNIQIGSVQISDMNDQLTAHKILWHIRFPRTLGALILGGALAVSGYLLQTFFHNPIAGPFVLGISSGAKMVVAILTIFIFKSVGYMSSFMMIVAALIGSLMTMGFVLLISRKVQTMSMLIVGGVMIGYICSAITELIITFASDADIINLHHWSRGTFSGTTWQQVHIMAWIVLTTVAITFRLSKQIAAYQLGENYALNLGVNVRQLRILLVLLSSILSACIVAFAGPISFVGIAVPQLIKQLFYTSKPMILIPGCFLGGSVFCLLCDLLARTVLAPTELSISTVTAIFGAPVVIWILMTKKKVR